MKGILFPRDVAEEAINTCLNPYSWKRGVKGCTKCAKKFGLFRWRRECTVCEQSLCSDCMNKIPDFDKLPTQPFEARRFCKGCYESHGAPALKAYNHACVVAGEVRTWPATYRGRVPYDPSCGTETVGSQWFRNRDHALYQIKLASAFRGHDLVMQVSYEKRTRSQPSHNGKGTYHYSEWRARGVAAKSKGSTPPRNPRDR